MPRKTLNSQGKASTSLFAGGADAPLAGADAGLPAAYRFRSRVAAMMPRNTARAYAYSVGRTSAMRANVRPRRLTIRTIVQAESGVTQPEVVLREREVRD